jgi:hypothetical protein
MEKKGKDFDKISQLYAQYTEKNKENLIKTAKNLLKLQKDNALLADAPCPPIEVEKKDMV